MGLKITHLMMFDCGESLSPSDRVKEKKTILEEIAEFVFISSHDLLTTE